MSEQTNNTNAAFMEVTSKKVEAQDRKIIAIEEKINNLPDNSDLMQQLITKIDKLQEDINVSRFPTDMVNDLTNRLDSSIDLFKQPMQNKILRHHHIPKITLIAAGLFLALSVTVAGWYLTADKVSSYLSSDTKYRYLKLDTGNIYLQKILYYTDSLCRKNVSLREAIIAKEEEYKNNFELLKKVNRMNIEAETLKANAKKLKEKAGNK